MSSLKVWCANGSAKPGLTLSCSPSESGLVHGNGADNWTQPGADCDGHSTSYSQPFAVACHQPISVRWSSATCSAAGSVTPGSCMQNENTGDATAALRLGGSAYTRGAAARWTPVASQPVRVRPASNASIIRCWNPVAIPSVFGE